MSAVVISESGTLYVADKTILVFNSQTGELCQEFGRVKETSSGAGGSKGRYSGLALTRDGVLIAARTEKAGCVLKVGGLVQPKVQVTNLITCQVMSAQDGTVRSIIDSAGFRLKRPTGLCVGDGSCYVYAVDIGAECVRKYRFK